MNVQGPPANPDGTDNPPSTLSMVIDAMFAPIRWTQNLVAPPAAQAAVGVSNAASNAVSQISGAVQSSGNFLGDTVGAIVRPFVLPLILLVVGGLVVWMILGRLQRAA